MIHCLDTLAKVNLMKIGLEIKNDEFNLEIKETLKECE